MLEEGDPELVFTEIALCDVPTKAGRGQKAGVRSEIPQLIPFWMHHPSSVSLPAACQCITSALNLAVILFRRKL